MSSHPKTLAYPNEARGPSRAQLALEVLFSTDRRLNGVRIPMMGALRVGRGGGPSLDLDIDDAKLSRLHATFFLRRGVASVEDHSSTNGTFTNGVRRSASVLTPGDIVRAGGTIFELVTHLATEPEPEPEPATDLIARSPAMVATLREIDRVAPTANTVLLIGETGTGKELLARRLHRASGRKGPLVAVDCAAIPGALVESALFGHKQGAFSDAVADRAGVFAQSQSGTLLLDEIGALPLEQQPALLRVLETKAFTPVGGRATLTTDARIVAATNRDLSRAAADGLFRHDLLARLAEYPIVVPPLRQRKRDIVRLLEVFLDAHGAAPTPTLSASLVEVLFLYPWPLNVRELRSVAHRLGMAGAAVLTPSHLPSELHVERADASSPGGQSIPSREELQAVLAETTGNIVQVAERYGRSRMQVYRWLVKYGLRVDQFRG